GGATPRRERSRAKKLARSARVILWFWILLAYVPDIARAMTGYSTLWRAADLVTTWGLIFVVYVVLSTWRAEIASLFEKLATDRLPGAVQFVHDNKDKPWGVLIVAGASIYVIVSESARLGRSYASDNELTRSVSNFIFRKQIELQRRDHSDIETDVPEHRRPKLPPEYVEAFADRPLEDEVFCVERDQAAQKIFQAFDDWVVSGRQGSAALIGETGIGKSTALHSIDKRMRAREDHGMHVVHVDVVEKIVKRHEALELVAQLFELDEVPVHKDDAVQAILACPPTIVLLDDCHHMFIRRIGGFAGLELFLEIANLTDGVHYYVLTFNRFAWSYLNRVRRREHFFGSVVRIPPWTEQEIQELIWTRNLMTGVTLDFIDLVVTRDEDEDYSYEVIRSAKGYFRLLHEFCIGNPRLALTYWLRSLRPSQDDEHKLQVGLFRTPPQRVTSDMDDQYWFTLTAIAQHGALNAEEISAIINVDRGFCQNAINFFVETDIVLLDSFHRARISALFLRQVLKQLIDSSYLYD
ncbi:MAG: hypothetical protein AAGI01_14115, partial [Myxococcota bacterium]